MSAKYMVRKHLLGLAILTWEKDPDYITHARLNGIVDQDESPNFHYLYLNVFDYDAKLVFEDSVGGIELTHFEGTELFYKQLLEAFLYTWAELGESI